MSFSSFPLEFVLQVRDDMSGGLGQATTELQNVDRAAQSAERSTGTLESRVKGANTNFLQLGLGIASAAGGIINLIRQYHNLQKAQRLVKSSTGTVENATINLQRKQQALADAIKEHGKNSEEAKKATDDVTKAENSLLRATNRLQNSQIALNDRMLDFAVSIVPSVVGVVAGLAQTFQITNQSMGGGRGFLGALGRFFLPLAALGAVLLAIKTNFLGFRDAINLVGFQIGQAVPALQPFLNALNDLGIILGIVPGDAEAAQEALKEFGGGVIQWGKDVIGAIQDVVKKLMSGDLLGAFNQIKAGVLNIAFQIGSIKIGSFTIEQWAIGIKTLIENEIKFSSTPIEALVNIIVGIASLTIGPLNTSIYQNIGKLFEEEFKTNPVTAAINLFTRVVDFTIISLLPADVAKLYLKFTQEWDRTKGQNAAKIIVPVIVTGVEFVQPGLLPSFQQIRTTVENFFKNPTAFGLAQITVDFSAFLDNLIKFTNPVTGASVFIQEQVAGLVSGMLKQLSVGFADMLNSGKQLFLDTGKAILTGIVNGMMSAPEAITEFLANLGNTLIDPNFWMDVGKRIGETIIDGLLSIIPPGSLLDKALKGDFVVPTAFIPGLPSGSDSGIFDKDIAGSLNPFRGNSTGGGGSGSGAGGLTGNNEDIIQPISSPFGVDEDKEETITVLQQILNDIVLIRSVATENFNAMGQVFNQVVTSMGAVWNTFAASVNTVLIALQASAVALFTQGIGLAWNTLMINMSSLANVTVQAIAVVFGAMVINISAGMTGLAATWSAICNSLGANAKSGASQIIAAFNSAASAAIAAFNRMRSAAQATFNAIVSAANRATSAVRSLISTMNSIPNIKRTITITTVRRTVNAAKGFNGIVTTPTTFNVGEGFKPELVSVTPLTGGGSASITNQVTTKNKGTNNNQPMIVQVFLDGKQIKGEVVSMLARNQSAMK